MKALPVILCEQQVARYIAPDDEEWRELSAHMPELAVELPGPVPRTLNDELGAYAVGGPGPGGAPARYVVGFRRPDGALVLQAALHFQEGDPAKGVNGLSNEVLLAIVADRLRCFEAGPFTCKENGQALANVYDALELLHDRTRKRVKRGVEGKQIA